MLVIIGDNSYDVGDDVNGNDVNEMFAEVSDISECLCN
jgi:hypothetical protein